jgi:NTE family protein
MSRYVNLIFQGGGVKGLSYAGALSRMPEGIDIRVVGGSSAGAIAAALIACGHDPRNLKAILETLDIVALLGKEAKPLLDELRELAAKIAALADRSTEKGVPLIKIAHFILWNQRSLKRQFQKLARSWGLFSSDALERWLAKKTDKRKFSDIVTHDLRIVASNVSTGAHRIYSKGETRNDYIHEAATASAMIPFFFEPRRDGGVLVDGGMLSNFPLFLFEREPFPTVGFRLRQLAPPTVQIKNFGVFSRQLLDTMMDAHDKLRPRPEYFHEEDILLPNAITAIDFDLNEEKKNELFQLGAAAGGNVNWQKFSSATPLYSGLDPKPDKVITRVLQNGRRLADAVYLETIRPEVLHDEAYFKVVVEPDWSVAYEVTHRYKVEGKRVLIGGASQLTFREDTLDLAKTSLSDLDWEFLEIIDSRSEQLPRFPAVNEVREKKFVYLFLPPVSSSDGPRTFVNRWKIPSEMASTVGRGNPDYIGYGRAPRADRHLLDLKIEVLIANTLGGVQLTSEDGSVGLKIVADNLQIQGVSYTRWMAGTAKQIELPGTVKFRIRLDRKDV